MQKTSCGDNGGEEEDSVAVPEVVIKAELQRRREKFPRLWKSERKVT